MIFHTSRVKPVSNGLTFFFCAIFVCVENAKKTVSRVMFVRCISAHNRSFCNDQNIKITREEK